MNWDAVGAIAELLGAAGVILTLAYLAVQIRTNTRALRNQSIHDSQEFVTMSCLPLIENEAVADIYNRGLKDFDALTEVEQVRFHYLCTQRIHAASATLAMGDQSYAYMSPHTWVERMMRNRGFRQWWQQRGQYVVDASFLELAKALYQDVESRLDPEAGTDGLHGVYRPPEAELARYPRS